MEVALALGAEIVSIDSAQVYRGMDVGTAKPSKEDRRRVPHHLIDIRDPGESVSVAEFQAHARDSIAGISQQGRTPLLVGGSGLYFRAVVDPFEFPSSDPEIRAHLEAEGEELGAPAMYERLVQVDPKAAARIQPANLRRVVRALEVMEMTGREFSSFRSSFDTYESIYSLVVIGLTRPIEELDRRIDDRVDEMFRTGLLAEVESLSRSGLRESLTSVQALGYAQVLRYLDGEISVEEAAEETKRRTRRFARRQLSWFRSDPRVTWFEGDTEAAAAYLVSSKEERPNGFC